MRPDGGGDIALRLPVRPCGKPNAICVGERPLAQAASATVYGAPFTASFSGAPAEHSGGGSFEIQFRLSEEPAGLSYRTVQNGLFDVTGANIGRAWRLQRGTNQGWGLRVEPSSFGDVTLTVRATTDCASLPGVCTSDGRMLAGGLSVTVQGPAAVAVADTEVDEAEGATLEFAVSLSRSSNTAATVDYATSDGTATAGLDYTANERNAQLCGRRDEQDRHGHSARRRPRRRLGDDGADALRPLRSGARRRLRPSGPSTTPTRCRKRGWCGSGAPSEAKWSTR